MAFSDRQRADALDLYWDAVINGETAPPPDGIDDLAASVIASLGVQPPSPDLEVVQQRLRRTIISPSPSVPESPQAMVAAPTVSDRPRRWPGRRTRHGWAILALAALLLLTAGLMAGLRTLGVFDDGGHTSGLAILAPASISPDGTVLKVTLPEDSLPTSDRIRTVLYYIAIPPGPSTPGSSNCCSGPMVEYVISGSYTVTVAADIDVIRVNGSTETVPANSAVTLTAGDSLITRSETVMQITVAGPEPATLLNWTLVNHSPDPTLNEEHVQRDWIIHRYDSNNPFSDLVQEPVTIQIRLDTAVGGDFIPAPTEGTQFLVGVANGTFRSIYNGSAEVVSLTGQPVTYYILTMTQPDAPPGTPSG